METLQEIKARIIASNPNRIATINLQEVELSDAEFNEAVEKRAQMEFEQEQFVIAKEAERQLKVSAYQKLGLTEAEIEALLPSTKPTRPPLE